MISPNFSDLNKLNLISAAKVGWFFYVACTLFGKVGEWIGKLKYSPVLLDIVDQNYNLYGKHTEALAALKSLREISVENICCIVILSNLEIILSRNSALSAEETAIEAVGILLELLSSMKSALQRRFLSVLQSLTAENVDNRNFTKVSTQDLLMFKSVSEILIQTQV